MRSFRHWRILALFLLFTGIYLAFEAKPSIIVPPAAAQSGGTVPVTGYAWSSNIGWVKFQGEGNPSSYGVKYDPNSGLFTGYAWSSNIGWVDFNPAGPFPGSPNHSARLENQSGNDSILTGWIRACAGASNAALCSGGTNPVSGGWDGWIKLSGSWNDGVKALGNDQIGYITGGFAWGSNVVGWLRFGPTLGPSGGGNGTPPGGGGGAPPSGCPANQVCIGGGGNQQLFPLTVVTTGSGSGRVTSRDGNIDCPGRSCNHNYTRGTSVTLEAIPATGSQFDGWLGCDSSNGICMVEMNSSKTVTSSFTSGSEAEQISIKVGQTSLGNGVIAVINPGDGPLCSTSVELEVFNPAGGSIGLALVNDDGLSTIAAPSFGSPLPHFGPGCPSTPSTPTQSITISSGTVRFRMWFPNRGIAPGSPNPSPYSNPTRDYLLEIQATAAPNSNISPAVAIVSLRYQDPRSVER